MVAEARIITASSLRSVAMSLRSFVLCLLLFVFPVHADDAPLVAHGGWIRSAPPVAKVRAGYVVIENASDAEIVLNQVESADFGAVEVHTMYDDAGTMRMRRVPELRIPAKGKVELKPGGLHLMMFRPTRPLADGEVVAVTLVGPDAKVAASLVVKTAEG